MKIWNYSADELEQLGALHTAIEIYGQPGLWRKVYEKISAEKPLISLFLKKATEQQCLRVVLTGAGTSAYIGLSLTGVFSRHVKKFTVAIPTTDLVTHAHDYLDRQTPTLLISFARSGNSPESVAAATVTDKFCDTVYHLIITCDATGALANFSTNSSKYVFVLPPEANDQSLAMTGSYSGMLLAGLLIGRLDELENLGNQIVLLEKYADKLLNTCWQDIRSLANTDFERAVFLGSGPMYGTAIESQLKLQELTDGKIICKHDSFLGFRHGPKAVVDEKTLVFFLFSNRSYVLQYERDLVEAMGNGHKAMCQAGLMEVNEKLPNLDHVFILSENGKSLEEEFLPVVSILPAQMLGFFKSLQLGLSPDWPSASGAISRVVKGVIIYPFEK
jgi:tagatose-6-phosphate ketose/aldose isomerase